MQTLVLSPDDKLKGIQEHVKKYTHLAGSPANLSANIPASCLRPARTGAAYAHSVRLDGHVRRTLGQLERVRSSVGRPSLMRLCPVVRRPAAAVGRAPVPRHAARARGDWAAALLSWCGVRARLLYPYMILPVASSSLAKATTDDPTPQYR